MQSSGLSVAVSHRPSASALLGVLGFVLLEEFFHGGEDCEEHTENGMKHNETPDFYQAIIPCSSQLLGRAGIGLFCYTEQKHP